MTAKSEGVGLISRAVSFQDFQPMWLQITNVTDGQTDSQTDRRHAIPRPRICTKVHCAVKMLAGSFFRTGFGLGLGLGLDLGLDCCWTCRPLYDDAFIVLQTFRIRTHPIPV